MAVLSESCGGTVASVCTKGRRKSGIQVANVLSVCDVLERIAQIADPEVRVWKGSGVPTTDQGIRVLGTPLGHADYVETQLV